MPRGIAEVEAAAAVPVVDAARLLPERVGGVVDPARCHECVRAVEVIVVEEKGVVLRLDVDRRRRDLQQDTVLDLEVGERSPGLGGARLEVVAVERGGFVAVRGEDDGVVETCGHGNLFRVRNRDCGSPDSERRRARRQPFAGSSVRAWPVAVPAVMAVDATRRRSRVPDRGATGGRTAKPPEGSPRASLRRGSLPWIVCTSVVLPACAAIPAARPPSRGSRRARPTTPATGGSHGARAFRPASA